MSATFFTKRSGADLVDDRPCVEEQERELLGCFARGADDSAVVSLGEAEGP